MLNSRQVIKINFIKILYKNSTGSYMIQELQTIRTTMNTVYEDKATYLIGPT